MKKILFKYLALILLFILVQQESIAKKMPGHHPPAFSVNLVVNSALCFYTLDNNPAYDEDNVAGQITVSSLLIQAGGSINYNDPGHPCSNPGLSDDGAESVSIIVNGNAEIKAGGSINTENMSAAGNGGHITLEIRGAFIMRGSDGINPGALISSGNLTATDGFINAGNVTIHAELLIIMEKGSVITAYSFKGKGGDIDISTEHFMTIDGTIISRSTGPGNSSNQGHGGMISLEAACTVQVADSGKVISKGIDGGADLVHLEACSVNVFGLVQSTGVGHGIPQNPPNHLSGAYRPDKPANSTAGIEIWSGNILIDALNHAGKLDAGTGHSPGGSSGTSWIDLFSRGNISILGNVTGDYAVNTNGNAGTNDDGGILSLKSLSSGITLRNLALQSSALGNGGEGGDIVVEAKTDIDLNNASLQASGAELGGGSQHGGHIAIRSFGTSPSSGNIVANSNANLDVTGGSSPDGTVSFSSCGTTAFPPGTITPSSIIPSTATACDGNPSFESYVTLPAANCQVFCIGELPLPVQLTVFTAKRNNNMAVLNWITSSEINNRGFEIQRRRNNTSGFDNVGFVPSLATGGNSIGDLEYEFQDPNIFDNASFYRLKQTDIDGRIQYSEIRLVNGLVNRASMIVYPNPSDGKTIRVIFASDQRKEIQLTDLAGKIVRNWGSFNGQQLDIFGLTPGSYLLKAMDAGTRESETKLLVVSK